MINAAILVVGGGAIGGVTAAKLTGEVRRVVVLDADREHVERLRGDGLLLDDLGDERRVVIEACADADELGERFDFALVTLKAAFHQAALPPLRERDVAESFVSLGNGLVQDRIAGPRRPRAADRGHRGVGRDEPRPGAPRQDDRRAVRRRRARRPARASAPTASPTYWGRRARRASRRTSAA